MNSFEQWWSGVKRGLRESGNDKPQVLAALEAVANSAWAACEQQLRSQWQPIDTAPKDGPFLVHGGLLGGELVDDIESLEAVKVDGRVAGDMAFKESDAVFVVSDACHHMMYVINPTHWMPLPQPPTS